MGALPSGTVTFLFTDIEGSTRLLESLGDRYRPLQDAHHRLIREAIEAQNGVVINTMGDGVFAAFASATSALSATVEAQRALATFAWPDDAELRVRMGLHSGEAVPEDDAYVSLAVHHAARVGNAGHGGQIVLSDSTRALVDGVVDVSFRDLGRHRLKDLGGPVGLHQVCHAELADGFPPLRSLDEVGHNLPVQLTTFIGRADEIVEVAKLVADNRLVTITGAGGAGKTRLALHVAADVALDFDGGAWFVELASVVDPDAVVLAVADTMQVRPESGRSPQDLVLERLGGPATLVVIDNCEHVLGSASVLCAAILTACPAARILTTSREPLGVPGETVWRIPSMAIKDEFGDSMPSDAVRLFLERATHVRPDWQPSTEERAAVVEICERLDGIPLGIELAAARLDVLSAEQIRSRLHDRFRLLTGGSRVTLERQRTLRATVDWSHALLDERAKVLLRRLAVFVGGFTLEAAEAVCADDALPADEILDLLGDLVRKSLVVNDRGETARRYFLLETIRQYAREALLDAEESEQMQASHYECLRAFLAKTWLAKDYVGFDWYAHVAAEDAELDNIVAALTWAADLEDPARLDDLLQRCARRWVTIGRFTLAAHWGDVALAHLGARPDFMRGRLLLDHSLVVRRLGDLASARAEFDRAVPLLVGDPEPAMTVLLLQEQARLLEDEADFDGARRANDEAIGLARGLEHRVLEAGLLSNQSVALDELGDHESSRLHLQAAREVARAANAPLPEAYATLNLVVDQIGHGDLTGVDELLDAADELARRVGDQLLVGGVLRLRFSRWISRDLARAEGIAEELLALARRTGVGIHVIAALNNASIVAWLRGDFAESGRLAATAHRHWLPTARPGSPSPGYDGIACLCNDEFEAAEEIAERAYRAQLGSQTQVGTYVAVIRRDTEAMRRWLTRADEQQALAGRAQRDTPDQILAALVAHSDGDGARARAELATVIADGCASRAYLETLDALTALAVVAATDGDADCAGVCLGLTTVVREATQLRRSLMGVDLLVPDTRVRAEAADAIAFADGWKRGQSAGVEGFFSLAAELAGAD